MGLAHTDNLGRYRVFGLQPGTYIVMAEPSGPAAPGPNQ